ncbi:TIGR01777 family oxidoreductase [Heliorestis convoluta]|uniref:TIGR01777 family protein n=1 Tax=Heliorestis convoluta TaxID=356322 RepID=A0A5Q2N4D4_9FIRM|nr:TIGR01777 family oxidoreductase [Heliorestis convoluta]QGG48749.1 TIGR01777 family protein [Heliorestis convoluta]
MNFLVTGGTGFVGKALVTRLLEEGHQVWVPTRRREESRTASLHYLAIPREGELLPVSTMRALDGIINLAGENIAGKRWSPEVKRELRQSRITMTRSIVESLRELEKQNSLEGIMKKQPFLLSASAVGYYGTSRAHVFTEDSKVGKGFLAHLCQDWEREALVARDFGVKVALLRFGLVLGPHGGVLKKMDLPFQFGAGGIIGDGEQWISWIHRDDLIKSIFFIMEKELEGPLNIVSPQPLLMRDFMKGLGKVLGRPAWTKLPSPMARLFFGEMAEELLLEGQQVMPSRLQEKGYTFIYRDIEEALRAIYNK